MGCMGGIGGVAARVYAGMFTFEFEYFSVVKPVSIGNPCPLKILTSRTEYIGVGGYASVQNIKSHIYGIPHIKYAPL